MTDKLDIKDVAKLVRADIAASMRAGTLPTIKSVVHIARYSLGQSVTVRVKAVPDDFVIPNIARLFWEHEHPHECAANAPEQARSLLSPEAKRLIGQLEALLTNYNRKSATNDRQWFHADVGFDGALDARQRAVCRYVIVNA